jgi:diguanylate cyclase (GGDEF)-like protein/PAS domain S-box-containing protein
LSRILEFETPEEMMAESALLRYKNPKDREVLIKNLREKGKVNNFDIELLTKTGKTKNVLLSATFYDDILSGMIMDITERKQAEEALRYRVEFEKLINILSTNFINIPSEDLDKWINFALASVGEFVGVDRSYVFLFSRDEKKMDNTHEWCDKGIEPQIQRLKEISIDTFPWFANRILKGETIHIPSVADLPPEANAEKEEFHLASIQSLINIPMIYRKSIIGFIGFDSVRKEKTWAEDNIMLLKILGEIFLNALVRKQADEALRESEERYRILFEESKEAIYITSQEGKFVDVNQSALDLFGYIREEMIGLNALQIYVNADERTRFQKDIEQTGFVRNYKVKFRKKDGTEMDCLLTSTLWKDINGTILGYQGIIRDITELKKVEDQLRYISLHDPLTSLYNRAYFEEEMHRVESGRYDSAGIIMCDVDGLKLVNDALGHYTGDNLLKETANILKESFREGDVAARVGGDEFAVLLPNSDRNAIEIARLRIQDAVERYNSSNPPLPLSISIGSAIGTGSSIIMTNLFKEADNNMYREKLQNTLSARSTIVQTLMKALETRDFTAKGHVSRLQKLSTDLAMSIGLQEQRITDLRLLAEFHDIGKVGISDHILFKTGPLTSEEIIEMQRHCEIGHRIALCTPDLIPIANLILKHHEWWNGKGYPLGIKGEEIPLECRVLAIAETYEAMTSDRPYHKAISHEEAVAELRRISGTKFAPDFVTKFIEVLDNIKE